SRRYQTGRVIERGREDLRNFRQRLEIRASPPERPQSAEELDPYGAADSVQFANEHRADLSGRPYVRAAASAPVETLDADHPQHAGSNGGLSQAEVFRIVSEQDSHGAVLEYGLIRSQLSRAHLIRAQ